MPDPPRAGKPGGERKAPEVRANPAGINGVSVAINETAREVGERAAAACARGPSSGGGNGPTRKLSPSSEVGKRRWRQDCRKERGLPPRQSVINRVSPLHTFPGSQTSGECVCADMPATALSVATRQVTPTGQSARHGPNSRQARVPLLSKAAASIVELDTPAMDDAQASRRAVADWFLLCATNQASPLALLRPSWERRHLIDPLVRSIGPLGPLDTAMMFRPVDPLVGLNAAEFSPNEPVYRDSARDLDAFD